MPLWMIEIDPGQFHSDLIDDIVTLLPGPGEDSSSYSLESLLTVSNQVSLKSM
jgi:hypothetical protein